MLKKLRIKFICINMTIVTIMLCVIFSLVFYFTKSNLENESIHMMQSIATNPTYMGAPYDFSPEVRLPYFVVQLDPQGKLLTTGGGFFDLSDEIFLQELIDASYATNNTSGILTDYSLRFIQAGNPLTPCLVFTDISSEQNTLDNLVKNCAIIGIISFSVFFVISILLARWAVKPVENAWTQQRQFIGDASHELKTPLTVILTNAELLQTEEFDAETKQLFSQNILTMSRQMQGLVEKLLDLARVDNGLSKVHMSSLNFSDLISDALLPFEPVYYEKGLTLQSQLEPEISVHANEPYMTQLVSILLDNAQKYSTAHSEINIALHRNGKSHCILSVSNPGEAISPQDQKNIFKRFYRIDKARSMNKSYGLGLSIAESIVAKHRGKIWCESQNNINTFYVRLKCS